MADFMTPLARRRALDGRVYLVRLAYSDGVYKLGATESVRSRFVSLAGEYGPIEPVHQIRTPQPLRLELFLRARFRDRCIGGELFKLTPDDVADIRLVSAVRFTRLRPAERVKAWRQSKGWTIRRMMAELDLSYEAVKSLEECPAAGCALSTLLTLAKAMAVPPETLV